MTSSVRYKYIKNTTATPLTVDNFVSNCLINSDGDDKQCKFVKRIITAADIGTNPGQIGDKYCWEGNEESGSGCQEITALVPNQKQSTKMIFYKPFESEATSDLILIPEGSATKVTWTMDCELDYPMNLMKLFMDSQMGKSYDSGLNALKALAEK